MLCRLLLEASVWLAGLSLGGRTDVTPVRVVRHVKPREKDFHYFFTFFAFLTGIEAQLQHSCSSYFPYVNPDRSAVFSCGGSDS